jgi:glycosyltransferase involved in cell wall biosynthesis
LWHENSPYVVLEALAHGRPAIVADREGMTYLIQDRKNGLVLPAGDVDAWRNALNAIAADPSVLRAMRARCHYDETLQTHGTKLEQVVALATRTAAGRARRLSEAAGVRAA